MKKSSISDVSTTPETSVSLDTTEAISNINESLMTTEAMSVSVVMPTASTVNVTDLISSTESGLQSFFSRSMDAFRCELEELQTERAEMEKLQLMQQIQNVEVGECSITFISADSAHTTSNSKLHKAASPYLRVRVRVQSACLHAFRKVCVRCAEISLYCLYRCCIDLPSQTPVRLQEQMFAVFTASLWSG